MSASESNIGPDRKEDYTDLDILNYMQTVKDEQAAIHPLVAVAEPISKLAEEYANGSQIYQKKIDNLSKDFGRFRRCRGDGNCFYRAFAFSLFEKLLSGSIEEHLNFIKLIEASLAVLIQAGFQAIVVEDFYDEVITQLKKFTPSDYSPAKLEELLLVFQQDDVSNSIVVFLRFLTSAYLKTHSDDYYPFIMDDPSLVQLEASGNPSGILPIDHFCNINIEAMGKESDEIHITLLSTVLKVKVQVAYLDGRSSDDSPTANILTYPAFDLDKSSLETPLTLLYRPGHYDIIYPN
ncbi:hypothetical protein DSO57_1032251 [Entomophthora muscae]|uniref:Uncharacterized protein n=1 Tax=Entomophthora muscae TaxID=34485 RepID=A0ACC2RRC9_9FUNG|nr:hypothetical protein DSO57_1032251 [Entomophthora muscae]